MVYVAVLVKVGVYGKEIWKLMFGRVVRQLFFILLVWPNL